MGKEQRSKGVKGQPWYERLGGDMENLPVDPDAPWEMIPIDPEWTKANALLDEALRRMIGHSGRNGGE